MTTRQDLGDMFPDYNDKGANTAPTTHADEPATTAGYQHSGDLGLEQPHAKQLGPLREQILSKPDMSQLPEASEVTQVADPVTGTTRFVVGQTAIAGEAARPALTTQQETTGFWTRPKKIGAAVVAATVTLTAGIIAWASSGGESNEAKATGSGTTTSAPATPNAAIAPETVAVTVTEPAPETAPVGGGLPENEADPASDKYAVDESAGAANPEAYFADYAATIMTPDTLSEEEMTTFYTMLDTAAEGQIDWMEPTKKAQEILYTHGIPNISEFVNLVYRTQDLPADQQDILYLEAAKFFMGNAHATQPDIGLQNFIAATKAAVAKAPAGGRFEAAASSGGQGDSVSNFTTALSGLYIENGGNSENPSQEFSFLYSNPDGKPMEFLINRNTDEAHSLYGELRLHAYEPGVR
jgi:hypothetical protein